MKIRNIWVNSHEFESARAVFVIHEHMGMALLVHRPCDCPNPDCENKSGWVDWQHHVGFHHAGMHVRAFDILGDTTVERFEFFREFDKVIRQAVGDYIYNGVTYHFTADPAPAPDKTQEYPEGILERAQPGVDPRWIGLIRWYWTWCQLSNEDNGSERLN